MESQTDVQEPRDRLLVFFRALGDVERLKIAGLLAQRPATVVELARALELREPDVVRHLARLEAAGLIRVVSVGSLAYAFDESALLRLKKQVARIFKPYLFNAVIAVKVDRIFAVEACLYSIARCAVFDRFDEPRIDHTPKIVRNNSHLRELVRYRYRIS